MILKAVKSSVPNKVAVLGVKQRPMATVTFGKGLQGKHSAFIVEGEDGATGILFLPDGTDIKTIKLVVED